MLRFPGVQWFDLAIVSATDAWAVGQTLSDSTRPVFHHYDGRRWVDHSPDLGEASVERRSIRAIDLLRSDLGFAISVDGAVWRWDGATWKVWRLVAENGMYWLNIDALSEDEIWLVGGTYGEEHAIARLSGQSWRTWTSPGPTLYSIAMASSSLGWAVGKMRSRLYSMGGTGGNSV